MVSDVDDPSRCRLVLIDFGYAAIGYKENEPLDGLAGSPEYAAPEVLSWLDGDGSPYYKSCDMWSVGVTAYVLLTGELPFTFPEELVGGHADDDGRIRAERMGYSGGCGRIQGDVRRKGLYQVVHVRRREEAADGKAGVGTQVV